MSSTRRVESGERRRQHGWASAPEYDVLRGLNGTAVASKAALQYDPQARELLYFLQSLSLREGGLKRITRELVEMFPERIGTPTMHKIGCKPGKRLTREQFDAIKFELTENAGIARDEMHELSPSDCTLDCTDDFLEHKSDERKKPAPVPSDATDKFIAECHDRCEFLDLFLEQLCCDPEITFLGGSVAYFDDVLDALFEFKRRHIAAARADHIETSSGKIIFEALDYMLETGRPVLIEGRSGYGKSCNMEAWTNMNRGRAICLELEGITMQKDFFLKLAKATGVARGFGFSAGKIKQRVTEFLQRTKLAVVISEAQYLWPQGKRIESHPTLINFLNTALFNAGVPYALISTEQFSARRRHVESQTDWSSEQLRRRIRRYFSLPEKPTTDDLRKVARKRLLDVGIGADTAIDRVVGYALASQGYFQTITDSIDDARLIAKRDGREQITYKDLKAAIDDWRAPSDAALQRSFATPPQTRRRGLRASQPLPGEAASDLSAAMNESFTAPERGFQTREMRPATRQVEPALAGTG